MKRHGYFFRQLLKLIAAVCIPLLALQAYNLYQSAVQAEQAALQAVDNHAAAISQDLDVLLADAANYLDYLSARPLVLAMDDAHCDPVLEEVVKRRRHFANVLITNLEGRPVCTSITGPGAVPPTYAPFAWFKQAEISGAVSFSKPFRAPIAQKMVSAMSRTLHDKSGRRVGMVSVLFDLDSLRDDWVKLPLPPNSRLSIIDRDGTIMVTSVDFARFVGSDASAVVKDALARNPGGIGIARGIDGVERVFAFKPIVLANWTASAAIPANAVFAASRAQLQRSLAATVVVLLMVLAFALAMARRMAAPLTGLARTAREVAGGRFDVRTSEDVPGEFSLVANEFNAMLDARQTSRVKELRQLDFYAALSRTNGSIVRMQGASSLYVEICRICVEHGHSSIAYISLVEGDSLVQAASAGPAAEFLAAFALVRADGNDTFPGVTGATVSTGMRTVVNDCNADERTAAWRSVADRLGTRSLASFPLKRGGRTIGALTLHMTLPGFFDEQVVALVDEMAGDISFALDNFAREEARASAERNLVHQQRQLAGLVNTAMDAIISIDASFKVVLFNRAAAELFCVSPTDAIGGSVDRFIPQRLHAAHREHVSTFARAGSAARPMGGLHSLVALRADGTEFPIEASISKLDEGSAALMTVVIRDATAAQEAARGRVAQAEAESSNRAKTTFLSRMSHELRTPLNAVLGFSQILQNDKNVPMAPKHLEMVDYIRAAGSHLLDLVNDVLDVTQIEAGRLAVEQRSVELVDVLKEAVRLNEAAAHENGIRIVQTFKALRPTFVLADPRRLRQVMINLLSNAIKYNRRHGQVELRVSVRGNRTVVTVDDTGVGMNASQMAHLYEPFNRLGREREHVEGTGLGLALARELVHLMQGQMQVTSEPGVGTCAEVVLLSLNEGSPANSSALDDIAEPDETSMPSGVVLYIEDSPVNVVLVEHLLMPWPDVTLLKAETGAEGIAVAIASKPDIILLDMRLPDMTGVEVLGHLFDNPSARHCRVVALSASAMPDEVEAATKAGASFYWTKPLDFKHFLGGMRRLLSKP